MSHDVIFTLWMIYAVVALVLMIVLYFNDIRDGDQAFAISLLWPVVMVYLFFRGTVRAVRGEIRSWR